MYQKRDVMVLLPELVHFSIPKRPTTGFEVEHNNVTLGTTTTLKRQHIVRCKSYLDISNCLYVDH